MVAVSVCVVLLAACGSSPSPTLPVESGSAPPGGSPAPSGSLLGASPAATGAKAAIEAFVDHVTAGGFSYVASFKGQSRHSVTILPIKGSLAVSGRDYALTANFTFPKEKSTVRVEQRYVRGVAWLRVQPGRWHRLTAFGEDDALSPFAGVLAASDVSLLSESNGSAGARYHIEMPAMIIHPSLIPAFNLSDEEVQRTKLDLVIDQAGRPISAAWRLNGTGRVSRQLQELIIELTLTFTKVGARVSVKAP